MTARRVPVTDDEIRMEAENLDLRKLLAAAGLVAAEHEASEKLQRLLLEEVHHRVKNMLAIVSAITSQSLASAVSLEAGREAIQHRLQALGRAQDLLLQANWQSSTLDTVIRLAIGPFELADADHFDVDVPEIVISAAAILPLILILNELTTNAIKYGALSANGGRVAISGAVDPTGDLFSMTWRESGGPIVAPPLRRSFGSKLIERGLIKQLAGDARLAFPAAGVVCSIDVPLAMLTPRQDESS